MEKVSRSIKLFLKYSVCPAAPSGAYLPQERRRGPASYSSFHFALALATNHLTPAPVETGIIHSEASFSRSLPSRSFREAANPSSEALADSRATTQRQATGGVASSDKLRQSMTASIVFDGRLVFRRWPLDPGLAQLVWYRVVGSTKGESELAGDIQSWSSSSSSRAQTPGSDEGRMLELGRSPSTGGRDSGEQC